MLIPISPHCLTKKKSFYARVVQRERDDNEITELHQLQAGKTKSMKLEVRNGQTVFEILMFIGVEQQDGRDLTTGEM